MRLVSARSRVRSSLEADSFVRHGVVGNISACHADARGSIPRFGVFTRAFIFFTHPLVQNASIGTRTRILTLEGLNTTLVLWTRNVVRIVHKMPPLWFTIQYKIFEMEGPTGI